MAGLHAGNRLVLDVSRPDQPPFSPLIRTDQRCLGSCPRRESPGLVLPDVVLLPEVVLHDGWTPLMVEPRNLGDWRTSRTFPSWASQLFFCFFCPSPLPFGGSAVLSLTHGPAGNRTTTGSLSAPQEWRHTNWAMRATSWASQLWSSLGNRPQIFPLEGDGWSNYHL